MALCVFCQGQVEPTSRRCYRCGRAQPAGAMSGPMAGPVAGMPIRQCPNCGEELSARTRFCPICGQTVGAPPQQQTGSRSGGVFIAPIDTEREQRGGFPTSAPRSGRVPGAPAGPQSGAPQVPGAPAGPQSGSLRVPGAPAGPQSGTFRTPSGPGWQQSGSRGAQSGRMPDWDERPGRSSYASGPRGYQRPAEPDWPEDKEPYAPEWDEPRRSMPPRRSRVGMPALPAQAAARGLLGTAQAKVIAAIIVVAILAVGGGAAVVLVKQSSSNTNVSTPVPSPTINVTGNWNTILTSSSNAVRFTMTLTQQGANLTGTLTSNGSGFPISGTISGQNITLAYTGTDRMYSNLMLTGTVNDTSDSISGTFMLNNTHYFPSLYNILQSDHGTWTATRT